MRRRIVLSAVVAMVMVRGPALAGVDMKPGLWEEVLSAPDGSFKTVRKCYLPVDIANVDRFQRGEITAPDKSCSASDYQADGNVVSYTLNCTINGVKSSSRVSATYGGDTVSGSIDRDGAHSTLTRHWIGSCDKSSLSN